ncbi:MAG TPA: carbohydrate porin [Vicinamibacterales bacterium]
MTGVRWALVLLLASAAHVRAQEAPSARPSEAPGDGVYVGGHVGVLGGSFSWSTPAGVPPAGSIPLFQGYDFVDGSGSHFGGLTVGYVHRRHPGLVLGAEGDLSFGAEPSGGNGGPFERAELFGTARGRVGYGTKSWFAYGTGGVAWARDQLISDPPPGGASASVSVFRRRIGWTLGVGIERPIDARWSADAQYLHTRFGSSDTTLGGMPITARLSTNQFRIGLDYRLTNADAPTGRPVETPAGDADTWNMHVQTTLVAQYAAPFHAPYRGTNSLDPNIARETWDVTFYAGRRLWKGAAVWINPEIDQGFGLSNTLGVGGFTSGEAYKLGYAHPYVRVPRAFVQQTIALGGSKGSVDAGLNQFHEVQTANRVVATIGKFSVSDIFDTITYAHDPRNDFMNWSLVDAATFDYAADAWGFAYGAALEWYQGRWVARGGLFGLSRVPNSAELDTSFGQYQMVGELEHLHALNEQPGKIAVVGFFTRGRMGRYVDALSFAEQHGTVANAGDVRQFGTRPGVNVNLAQQVRKDIGVFARAGWADGSVEPYEFTDVDRTASAGVSLAGPRWGRRNDTIGAAAIVNDVSAEHRAYLAAGGLGILVGDGQLPHPGVESIVESYYRMPVGPWQLTADYQFIVNPAFNRDRGPVSVFSVRLRAQF